ncbi:MAG: hypothetical protein GY699_19770 [Desulfobacteraceae bacterium]|nr:hypothetical protein [Desulfobacteraceae bacterium]
MNTINHNVKLIIYTEGGKKYQKKILPFINNLIPEKKIVTYSTIQGLEADLRVWDSSHKIFLFYVTSEKEIINSLALKSLLKDHSIILILPDSKCDLITKAIKLYPRYISYATNDFTDVNLVLEKMINNYKSKIGC